MYMSTRMLAHSCASTREIEVGFAVHHACLWLCTTYGCAVCNDLCYLTLHVTFMKSCWLGKVLTVLGVTQTSDVCESNRFAAFQYLSYVQSGRSMVFAACNQVSLSILESMCCLIRLASHLALSERLFIFRQAGLLIIILFCTAGLLLIVQF